MQYFDVCWSPTGQVISRVWARTERAAIRRAPRPYRKYLGELYAVPVANPSEKES
jgi:hypothetical protein